MAGALPDGGYRTCAEERTIRCGCAGPWGVWQVHRLASSRNGKAHRRDRAETSRKILPEHSSRLIPKEDADVSDALRLTLEDEGIGILTDATAVRVEGRSGETVRVVVLQRGSEKVVEASHLLAAAGWVPNTEGIGLERAGIATTDPRIRPRE